MDVTSHLVMSKRSVADARLTSLWNNLIRAVSIVNGVEPPSSVTTIKGHYTDHVHTIPGLDLVFQYSFACINIKIRCGSGMTNNLGGVLEIIAATTSALEYVVDREESIAIENWNFLIGNAKYEYQDVGLDSLTAVLGVGRENAIDLLEKHVEPKLDEIEKVCL